MNTILLSGREARGRMALVDDEDHGLVTSVKEVWFVHKYGHAQASIWGCNQMRLHI